MTGFGWSRPIDRPDTTGLYQADGYYHYYEALVKPVVTLQDDITIDHTNPELDGSSPEKAWALK